MRRFGWGIVGFGWVARDFGVPAIRAADAEVVAVIDADERARLAAIEFGLNTHADLDEMLADERVDAVYVATPNDAHRDVVEAAVRAGRAVLCEKPMAATLQDAEAMARAVRHSGVVYGTAFDQRHHPGHQAMRDVVRDGEIGTVTAVRIVYACWLGRAWHKTGAENWRADPVRAGGGALMDLAPHGLDLVDFLLDEPVREVAALTQRRIHDYAVDDGAVLVGRTASGVLVSLHVAYNHPETLPRRRLEIVGTGGMLVAENTMGQEAGGTVWLRDAADGQERSVAFEDVSPFERQMRAFAAAVGGHAPASFDIERDLRTMRLISRAYENAA